MPVVRRKNRSAEEVNLKSDKLIDYDLVRASSIQLQRPDRKISALSLVRFPSIRGNVSDDKIKPTL